MRTLLLFFFLSLTIVQAQDYATVDARVKQYPKKYASVEALVAQIQKDFSSDSDKVRAVFTWLASNITYDMHEYLNGERLIKFQYSTEEELLEKQRAIKEYAINSTLSDNKAVCEGYAQTFKKACELMGIMCLFIDGYSKINIHDIGKNPSIGDHAWNAVKIDNQWKLVDVTWASGSANGKIWRQNFSDYYFFTDADDFVKTHLPSSQGLSFSDNEPTKNAFFAAPVYTKGYFRNNIKLIGPQTGEISTKPGEAIKFEVEKPKDDVQLHYAFGGERYPKEIELNCSSGNCTFEIPFSKNSNTVLYIIANRQTALQYKIKVSN